MNHGARQQVGRIAQAVFLFTIAVYMAALLSDIPVLSSGARFFPILILGLAAIFVVLKAVSVGSPAAGRYLEPDIATGLEAGQPFAGEGPGSSNDQHAEDEGAPAGRARLITAWLWVAGAVASMYLVGFLVGMTVSILVYLRFVAFETWRTSAIVSGATLAFAYLVFARAMHIEFDLGLVGKFLGIG